MGFLDDVKKILSFNRGDKTGTIKDSSSAYHLSSELRLHARYFVLTSDLASLEITATGAKGSTKDLSYGGILADFKEAWLQNPLVADQKSIEAKLTFLDQSAQVFVQVVHEKNDGQTVGLSFIHKDIKTLVFLRDVLENLRVGSTFSALDPSHTKGKFNVAGQSMYRGDGPSDLQILEKDGNIQNILLIFRSGPSYFEFKMDKDILTTARSKNEDQKVSSQMEPSPEGIDISILRNATQLILGFLSTHPESKMLHILPKIYKELYRK